MKLVFKFTWIRSHSGNEGNQMADNLTKSGAVAHRSIDFQLIPMSYIKKHLYNKNIQIWNSRWNSSLTGETTKKYFPIIGSRLKAKNFFKADYYLTQFITNHGKFNSYLNRFKLRDDSNCDHCNGIIGDAEHMLYTCPQFNEERQILIDLIQQNNIN